MRTMLPVVFVLTAICVLYAVRKPALKWAFSRDQPETPEGWQPKMITWTNGVRQ